jgi:hypothetical protein
MNRKDQNLQPSGLTKNYKNIRLQKTVTVSLFLLHDEKKTPEEKNITQYCPVHEHLALSRRYVY